MRKSQNINIDNFKSLELTNQNNLIAGNTNINRDGACRWKLDRTVKSNDSVDSILNRPSVFFYRVYN